MESVGCLYDISFFGVLSRVSLDWLLSAKIPAARFNLFFLNFVEQAGAFSCLLKSLSLHLRVVFSSLLLLSYAQGQMITQNFLESLLFV